MGEHDQEGAKVPTPLSKNEEGGKDQGGCSEGAGYSPKGVYRGVQDCRMRINETPEFCAVCQDALKQIIDLLYEVNEQILL